MNCCVILYTIVYLAIACQINAYVNRLSYVKYNRIYNRIKSIENFINIDNSINQLVSIGNYVIVSEENDKISKQNNSDIIYLSNIKYGWGDGQHPTTRLCLEFINNYLVKDMKVLDYGTGSGILSIFATKLGASKCIGVEVDESSLQTALTNSKLNNVDKFIDIRHTSTIYLGDDSIDICDMTIANILPGALVRLAGLLWGLTKPGGLICLSGMRPHQLESVKQFYKPYINESTEVVQTLSHPVFGDWICWSFRTAIFTPEKQKSLLLELSDLASQ